MTPRLPAATLTAAALLTLAGCGQPLPEPEIEDNSAAQSAEQSAHPVTETVTEEAEAETAANDADPADYVLTDTAYAMHVAKGSECLVPDDPQEYRSFNCTAMFDSGIGALVGPGGGPGTGSANIVLYDPVLGFHTGQSEQAGQFGAATELRPGQRITIAGFTVTRTAENSFKVERGAHWFTIHDGALTLSGTALDAANISTSTSAPEGSLCGIIDGAGGDLAVIAASPNTNCPTALETAELYSSPDRPGELQGSTAFWDAPNGWRCGRGWQIPGMDDIGANQRPTCSADRNGSVVIAETLLF